MKNFFPLIVFLSVALISFGQNISVTFTGTGAATQVDSVSATNLRKGISVSLPGNATLLLTGNSGVPDLSGSANLNLVYPNPFSDQATFSITIQKPQQVYVKVQNLVGEILAAEKAFLQPGENDFTLSVATAGIYSVSLTTDQGTAGYKVICTETTTPENSIQYLGSGSDNHNNHNNQNNHNNCSQTGLKSFQSGYILEYKPGDVILYRCTSGIYTTIITDSPAASKNYEVEFNACTDPDGRNYSVVKIGEQTWMAENLAYLPEVSPPTVGFNTDPYYYVYGNQGTSISDARSAVEFSTYGVLYSWPAAMNGSASSESVPSDVQGICPTGWHNPSDEEWKTLEKFLGMTAISADSLVPTGYKRSGSVGGQLKEAGSSHWRSPNVGATNSSGFSALPGGLRFVEGTFAPTSPGWTAYFWTSTMSAPPVLKGFMRGMYDWSDGIGRYEEFMNYGAAVRCIRDE